MSKDMEIETEEITDGETTLVVTYINMQEEGVTVLSVDEKEGDKSGK